MKYLIFIFLIALLFTGLKNQSIGERKDDTQYIIGARYKTPTVREYAEYVTRTKFGVGHVQAMNNLIESESGFNPVAVNRSSGAAGLPQSLPAGKMGCNISWNPRDYICQLNWMANYVKDRYGNPSVAWAYHERVNWY